jgi:putative nucleotidyltransferase with HDIG domain
VVVGAVSTILALAVYVRDRRNPANRSFAATATASIVWLSFALLSDMPDMQAHALLLNRLTIASSMIMGVTLVHFALVFPSRSDRVGLGWYAFLFSGLVGAALTATTSWVVGSVAFSGFGTDIIPGPGMVLFAAWLLAGIISLAVILGRKYRAVAGREKAQVKFLLLGMILFTVFSVVFGLLLPTLTGSYAFAVLNTFTPLFLIGFTSYAMIKYRLMDMRFIVIRGMVYTVLLGLLTVFYLALAQLVRTQFVQNIDAGGDIAFVLGGLAAVFIFQPLRTMLESYTDHIFYRRRHDQHTLLQRLSVQLVGVVDLSEIASAASKVLGDQIKASRIALVHDEGEQLAVYGGGVDADDPALREIIAASQDRGPVLDDELEDDSPVAALLSERGIKVVAPLIADEVATAVLLLGEKQSGEVYTEQDLRFLSALSTELAIALRACELFEQREQRVRELTALNRLASALGQDIQLDSLLNRALRQVVSVAGADGGSIMLLDPATDELLIRSAFGLSTEVVSQTRLGPGEGIAGWVAQHRKPLLVIDGDSEEFRSELMESGVKSALSVPLVSKEHIIGVLNLRRMGSATSFTQQNMSVVTAFASQLAMAIENAQLYADLEGYFLGTITALAAAVDAKDPYTFGHSSGVTETTLAIAGEMGLDDKETETLRMAAILHDIGKIGIDGAILNKEGPLDSEERDSINRHPIIGANILSSLDFLEDVVPIVLHHHERYGGGGYPDGIAGEDIPLGARIITVADSYDAMTSDRTYRPAMSASKAIDELTGNVGSQFDPDVVAAFLRVAAHGGDPERELASVGAGHDKGRKG